MNRSGFTPQSAAHLLRRLAAGLARGTTLPSPQDLGLSPQATGAILTQAADLLHPEEDPSFPESRKDPGRAPAHLYCDGASRGNPGPAGAGAVLLDGKGKETAVFTQNLGKATNNAAEYRALLLGLKGARDLGLSRLEVRLDSELLVRQINGQYRVKSPHLKPLYNQVLALLDTFERVIIKHVSRTENRRADELANQAIDQA